MYTEKNAEIEDKYIYEGSLIFSDLKYLIWEFSASHSKLTSQNINS